MKRIPSTLLAVALTAAFAAPAAYAQGSASPPGTGATGTPGTPQQSPGARTGAAADKTQAGQSTLGQADRQFVTQAAMAGMAEVRAGELASQKASSPQVREFAQRMVDQQTRANAQLMQIAGAKGVAVPDELDRAHRQTIERMEKMTGAEFDRAYMKAQVSDHEKAVSLYERQAKSGRDEDLKSFAQAQLPTLREHLKMARADMQQLDAGAGRPSGSTAARPPGEGMTGSTTGGTGPATAAGGASPSAPDLGGASPGARPEPTPGGGGTGTSR